MSVLADLLLEAGHWQAQIARPSPFSDPESVLDSVRAFMRIEERIYALPEVAEGLVGQMREPMDPSGRRINHAFMAAMVLARTGWAGSAAAMLALARSPDRWCATQARMNLAWLEPTAESAAALTAEVEAVERGDAGALPGVLVAGALAQQRNESVAPLLTAFIDGGAPADHRAAVLTALVNAMPAAGLDAAAARLDHATPVIAATAAGLRAVFGDEAAYQRLLAAGTGDAALHWLGRIPRPDSIAALERGLAHAAADVRLDVVTSLACFGEPHAWELVLAAIGDTDRQVAEQATNFVVELLADDPDFEDLQRRWEMDASGRLTARSRRDVTAIAQRRLAAMTPGVRHHGRAPLELARVLDDLYRGTLPHYLWYQWVAATGVHGPYAYAPALTTLRNFPTLEQLEDWYQQHGPSLVPGAWYYAGRRLPG